MNKQKNAALVHRIQWVDIAKGMAMLFVIIGHTAPFGSMERNFIFSFHMPLFFLLSGYTLKFADSWEAAGRQLEGHISCWFLCLLSRLFLCFFPIIMLYIGMLLP